MLSIKDSNIYLTKGDTAYLKVVLVRRVNDNTYDYEINNGDKLVLIIKKNVVDEDVVIQKEINAREIFKFESTDTSELQPGKYYYEVKLTNDKDEVFTVVPLSSFYLERGIN